MLAAALVPLVQWVMILLKLTHVFGKWSMLSTYQLAVHNVSAHPTMVLVTLASQQLYSGYRLPVIYSKSHLLSLSVSLTWLVYSHILTDILLLSSSDELLDQPPTTTRSSWAMHELNIHQVSINCVATVTSHYTNSYYLLLEQLQLWGQEDQGQTVSNSPSSYSFTTD